MGRLLILGAIGASFLLGCRHAPEHRGPFLVSLVHLLATPEKLEGSRVQVRGYLETPGSLSLYLTREHAAARDYSSSIQVNDTSPDGSLVHSSCLAHWVALTGTVERRPNGSFEISGVEEVLRLDTLEYCWRLDEP